MMYLLNLKIFILFIALLNKTQYEASLKDECLIREIISRIQKLRKEVCEILI
jgi:hypothetical protein